MSWISKEIICESPITLAHLIFFSIRHNFYIMYSRKIDTYVYKKEENYEGISYYYGNYELIQWIT